MSPVFTGLSHLDYFILIAYLVSTVFISSRFAKRQKSLDDYFVAGRMAPWWAVGISIAASDLSAISYMGAPAWVFEKDLRYAMGIFLFPFMMILVVYIFVPFLARLRLYTIYEYLERRFHPSVRTVGSALFLLLRGGWMSTAIYALSLVISQLIHLPVWECVIVVGGLTTAYTVLGGMQAVLWTDVMQFCVMVTGIFVMIGTILVAFHGDIRTIWRLAADSGHTRMFSFQLDPNAEVTVWALFAGTVVVTLISYGSDQVIVQRYLTTSSQRNMALAVLFNGVIALPVMLLLYLLGIGFVAFYAVHHNLRVSLGNAQQVLPHFVIHVLPPGLSGLVIAALCAATMSALSAGLNSFSTVTVVDFYGRYYKKLSSSNGIAVSVARWSTLAWGVMASSGALFVGRLGGIIEIVGKMSSFFGGPLLGMFLLGILTRRANSLGALLGCTCGVTATWLVSSSHVSWLWYGPIGCLSTLVAGYATSYLGPAISSERVIPLTIYAK